MPNEHHANEYFRSFFIFWQPQGASWKLPIFPGGYLVGGLLLINLFAAHFRYYRTSWKKLGIAIIHIGIVMLLLGQLLTDLLSVESHMHIRNGESKNYSEAGRSFELAIVTPRMRRKIKWWPSPVTGWKNRATSHTPNCPLRCA